MRRLIDSSRQRHCRFLSALDLNPGTGFFASRKFEGLARVPLMARHLLKVFPGALPPCRNLP